MHESAIPAADPRWGGEGREVKAEAIFLTIKMLCSEDLLHGTWLDVGCGSGGVAATLAQRTGRVIGIDPEPWERWSRFVESYPNLVFQVGSYRELDEIVGRGMIDVAVCNQVYEHVDDPAALLVAIHDALRPGGVCYFAGPNLLWPIEPHVFWPFVHWLPRRFAQKLMWALGSKRTQQFDAWSWTYWKLKTAFHSAGFTFSEAIHERIRAQAEISGSALARIAALVPRVVVRVLAPFSPGFVFILSRPSAGEGRA